jgi:murein DD-endopeptidase MepM/ murein hydrolase activator NlpD
VKKLLLTVVVLAAALLGVLLFKSKVPVVALDPQLTALGGSTPVHLRVQAPHGVRSATAVVEQGAIRAEVWRMEQPARRFVWQRHLPPASLQFVIDAQKVPGLREGRAKLTIEVTANDFRAASTSVVLDLPVALRPPQLSVDSEQHYLYLGMAELVTFNVTGSYSAAGVRVGDQVFRAWPMPGGKGGLFSLFAFAWNMAPDTVPQVFASNSGNEAKGTMIVQFPKKEQPHYRERDLALDDHFLQKAVNELDPNGTGDLVPRFLKINGEMRRANNRTLADLKYKTAAQFLWSEPFQQQRNSKVESNFADVRNYIYQGRKIDQQVHLGYDLSVTQHVGVEATNDGRVIYAAPLGIYGNCVVVDHGYGLQSIYGHMSEIAVHEGDMVKRGQVMGKSGMTGLAGGDHIHFSMQLEGIQIDPKEWWDRHWIKDHIAKRVGLPGFDK